MSNVAGRGGPVSNFVAEGAGADSSVEEDMARYCYKDERIGIKIGSSKISW